MEFAGIFRYNQLQLNLKRRINKGKSWNNVGSVFYSNNSTY